MTSLCTELSPTVRDNAVTVTIDDITIEEVIPWPLIIELDPRENGRKVVAISIP